MSDTTITIGPEFLPSESPQARERRMEKLLQRLLITVPPRRPSMSDRLATVSYSAFCMQWVAVAMCALVGRE